MSKHPLLPTQRNRIHQAIRGENASSVPCMGPKETQASAPSHARRFCDWKAERVRWKTVLRVEQEEQEEGRGAQATVWGPRTAWRKHA